MSLLYPPVRIAPQTLSPVDTRIDARVVVDAAPPTSSFDCLSHHLLLLRPARCPPTNNRSTERLLFGPSLRLSRAPVCPAAAVNRLILPPSHLRPTPVTYGGTSNADVEPPPGRRAYVYPGDHGRVYYDSSSPSNPSDGAVGTPYVLTRNNASSNNTGGGVGPVATPRRGAGGRWGEGANSGSDELARVGGRFVAFGRESGGVNGRSERGELYYRERPASSAPVADRAQGNFPTRIGGQRRSSSGPGR